MLFIREFAHGEQQGSWSSKESSPPA